MTISEILLQDFDNEMKGTRTTLERVPVDKPDFKCHDKSMPLGKLAMHVASIPRLATAILTTPGLDIANSKFPPLVLESREQLLATFDELSAQARAALVKASDTDLQQNWKFTFGDKVISDVPRSAIYRGLFFNHLIHHRAQLGVYLRLNNIPVPALYGPSADDNLGFR